MARPVTVWMSERLVATRVLRFAQGVDGTPATGLGRHLPAPSLDARHRTFARPTPSQRSRAAWCLRRSRAGARPHQPGPLAVRQPRTRLSPAMNTAWALPASRDRVVTCTRIGKSVPSAHADRFVSFRGRLRRSSPFSATISFHRSGGKNWPSSPRETPRDPSSPNILVPSCWLSIVPGETSRMACGGGRANAPRPTARALRVWPGRQPDDPASRASLQRRQRVS